MSVNSSVSASLCVDGMHKGTDAKCGKIIYCQSPVSMTSTSGYPTPKDIKRKLKNILSVLTSSSFFPEYSINYMIKKKTLVQQLHCIKYPSNPEII